MTEFLSGLSRLSSSLLPRILTQICRDPTSPHYGCCDRNWWHYRIRDFPSVILQQAGYTISIVPDTTLSPSYDAAGLRQLSAASARFWNKRALKWRAFEEYYPYEEGYPPLAFSTLSVAKLCRAGVVPLADVWPGLRVAARQVLRRFEGEAANQQIAGTAALAVLSRIAPELVSTERFGKLLEKTLSLQTEEGWFPEYHGPDTGYLSVALDCLWDIYDVTGDTRVLRAIEGAFSYISWFVLGPLGGAGMHNSRNTDYIVPYGIARLMQESTPLGDTAYQVLRVLYSTHSEHLRDLEGVDDRYWCHYMGHSMLRAVRVLHTSAPRTEHKSTSHEDRDSLSAGAHLSASGHVLLRPGPDSPAVLVSTRKGGVFTAQWADGKCASDYGWLLISKRHILVSHWWSSVWESSTWPNSAQTNGTMFSHKERVSSPLKHAVLRILSFVFGRRIIGVLKRVMVFKTGAQRVGFRRSVHVVGDEVVVEDRIIGARRKHRIERAPRASKRHVASADTFHKEDFALLRGISRTESFARDGVSVVIRTRYAPSRPHAV